MKHATPEDIAREYIRINHWLANRYARTDKHGRRWLQRLSNGKLTRYARLETALRDRYLTRFKEAREI